MNSVLDTIDTGFGDPTMQTAALVDEAVKTSTAAAVVCAAAGVKPVEKRAIIVIDQVEGMPNYEFVGVNGKGFQIQRGVEVDVPASVIGVLNTAIAARPTLDHAGRVIGEQDYHAIPFRIIRWL